MSVFRFLYKDFALNGIVSEGVKPTLSEIESFEECPENADIELNEQIITTVIEGKDKNCGFSAGDNVEVREGELVNLCGKVIAVDGLTVTVMPNHKELTEPLEFAARELKKYFTVGDHVKVCFYLCTLM